MCSFPLFIQWLVKSTALCSAKVVLEGVLLQVWFLHSLNMYGGNFLYVHFMEGELKLGEI